MDSWYRHPNDALVSVKKQGHRSHWHRTGAVRVEAYQWRQVRHGPTPLLYDGRRRCVIACASAGDKSETVVMN